MYGPPAWRPVERLVLFLAVVLSVSELFAQSSQPTLANLTSARVEAGMSTSDALARIGREPDQEVEIGAACGVLQIMSWDDSQMRIISVGGVVASIAMGDQPQR
ncbi:MAG: hypothetical protein ACR2RL_10735 [Gammaproteobacteria bacterium]